MISMLQPSFKSKKERTKFCKLTVLFSILSLLVTFGLLVYNNPVPMSSSSFVPVVRRRIFAVVAMLVASLCQSLGTLTFQTITVDRIITPSLLGFEAIYSTIQTIMIFLFGTTVFTQFVGLPVFLLQIGLMVGFSVLLFSLLFTKNYQNIHFVLLVGVIIGIGLRSFSSFLRRLLSPSEFDILQVRLFASVNNAQPDYLTPPR